MKKIFRNLLIAVFCGVILTGCSSSSIVGTWKTEEVLIDGDFEYIETVTFNEDHTGVITYERVDIEHTVSTSLTWTQSEGNKYLISIDRRGEFLVEISDGKFTVLQGMSRELYEEKDVVYVKQ